MQDPTFDTPLGGCTLHIRMHETRLGHSGLNRFR